MAVEAPPVGRIDGDHDHGSGRVRPDEARVLRALTVALDADLGPESEVRETLLQLAEHYPEIRAMARHELDQRTAALGRIRKAVETAAEWAQGPDRG